MDKIKARRAIILRRLVFGYGNRLIDDVRLHLADALLLGRIFSWINIVAYTGNIVVAASIEGRLSARARLSES